ncbi:NAD(P)H-dependent oxidoreductase [uncultured Shimia sp.]|uniref:NAD(P)H-dependent oxidoreductase n=1 Tax=uncultured Shimia sp. TaxID=573152 RepID=UPI0025F14B83|nr:NAD(P)H-dependent oxidoreductase [uncultured Shimia sp.]
MQTVVLTAHPALETSTVNRQWFDALSQIDGVTTRDLTAVGGAEMRFDPIAEQTVLQAADRVVLQFPFYWYSSPPVLKAWLDQVLLPGFAYGPGGDKMHGKELGVAVSTGGPAESYAASGMNSFPMQVFLSPFEQTAKMLGMRYLPPFVLHSAMSRDPAQVPDSVPAVVNYVTTPLSIAA